MNARLLETRFHLPPLRPGDVSRPRLVQRLQTGLDEQRKLSLISAPAGYGKTTLAAEWLHSPPGDLPTAWLSLDESDNDPRRFLAYFLAALRRIDASVGQSAQDLLSLPQLPPLQTILDELLNDLSALPGRLLLALDDLHLIRHPGLRQALEYFSANQPAQLHLLLLSREDPLLPLARLRARRQMTEIRLDDLRFTLDEAQAFFHHAMQLDLDAQTVDALEARTEGWAAGLQLAALALQNRPDRQDFIDDFRGSHRYVLDYLAEEVIRQQDEEVRRFLIQTSILERFNAALCAAITGHQDCQALIQRLEQANLFILPLDDRRLWYRYHHLFAAYLRTELPPAEAASLYRKAAAWHEASQLTFEAVQYALASGDPDFAAQVIERALSQDATWSGGEVAALSSWLDALPAETMDHRPQLSLHASRLLYLAGRFEEAEARIAQAERHVQAQPEAPEADQVLALAALYRGSIASVRGDFEAAIQQTTFAQERLAPENHLAQARAFFSLGLAYELADQTGRAIQDYLRSSDEALLAGVLFLAIHARCAAAQLQIQQGRLSQAEQTCQQAIRLTGGARLPPLGLAYAVLGGIAVERSELDTAGQLLEDGLALSRRGGLVDDAVLGLVHLARLHAVQGDQAAADAAIQEAVSAIQIFGVERMTLRAAAGRARLQVFTGQAAAAAGWAAEYRAMRLNSPQEFEDLILARFLLAAGQLDDLPSILHPILEQAVAAGRQQSVIEAHILLALYHRLAGNLPAAVEALAQALRLAAPERYARLFLDEGQPLLDLLPRARQAAPEYVDALLAMGQPERPQTPAPLAELPDPLSEQELRVLQLIVAGKSNREIAAELVISLGTAKWHVHNVLHKLGVGSRAQAIARARQLGVV